MNDKIQSIDPATGAIIAEYSETTEAEARKIIEEAHAAFEDWKSKDYDERGGKMHNAAKMLLERKREYAELMAYEMGKPLKDGIAEIEKCAWACNYFAEHAEEFLQPESVQIEHTKSFIAFEPIGVVLAVMPWNFPFWQAFRFIAPSLMAGNAAVLKHASNVSGCSLAIEAIMHDAGFTPQLFRSVLIPSKKVNTLIEHPLIRAVTLTGSKPAGQSVAAKAGSLLKKTVLELGGSDPYLILEDADLGTAAQICVTSRLINCGQSCIAAKRFIVIEKLKEKFEEYFIAAMKTKIIGNPFDDKTDIGPLARYDLRDALHRQVQQSIGRGAKCLMGGTFPEGDGAYYPPTILTNVTKGMPAYEEELFGPVAAIISAADENDAIRIANDTEFGLGAAVFSTDLKRAEIIARKMMDAGSCFVNDFVKSDPRLPFGGVKSSGYGRELSHYGIKEFVNVKSVVIH